MVIDSQRKVFAVHLRRMVSLFAFAAIIIVLLLTGSPSKVYFGVNKHQWAIIFSVIYVLLIIAEAAFELNYIFFSDDNDKIILRYFSLSYFNSKKNSIEIPLSEFVSYELKTSLGGAKTKIILYRQIKNREAKYPPVCLSLLSKKEIGKLTACLDRYKKL